MMKKSMIAKITSAACCIVTLGALGIAASAATNEPIPEEILTAGKVNIVAGVVRAEAGEVLDFPVYIYNNKEPGFAATGIRLFHDEEIKPVIKSNGKPDAKLREVALDPVLSSTWDYNEAERLIALGTMGDEATPNNGVLFVAKVQVPEKPIKTKFPMTLEIDKFLDAATNPVDYATIDGYIYIDVIPHIEPGLTTTATSATTTVTSSTVTSAAPTTVPTTVTTAPTTAPTQPTTSSVTTVSAATAKPGAVTTTKAPAAVTTTKAGTTGSTTATKTGDAGVGAAVAGLLLASGTAAAVTRRKKKD